MTGVGVTQDVALDRREWRRRTIPIPREKVIKVSEVIENQLSIHFREIYQVVSQIGTVL